LQGLHRVDRGSNPARRASNQAQPTRCFCGRLLSADRACSCAAITTNEAVIWLEKARNTSPAHPNIRAQLASAYALAGEPERAAAELAEARRLSGDDRFSSLARLREVEDFGQLVPKVRALFEATYIAGLRKAGMPEG
jgi:alkanesulfonate monooxygenase SsuD/methylene tetrahydromethanopterin reductase-like flavin-dependent oxidoreductase (luciferase family)